MSAFENIPRDMTTLGNWLVHRSKQPYDPATGYPGSPTDPKKWTSFERAVSRFERGGFDGIGFGMLAGEPYCGVDLDHCLNPATGEITEFAADVVRRLDSYTEVTPSGEGLRVWIKAVKPAGKCKRAGEDAIEVYDRGRYFTVTGCCLPDSRRTIENRQSELEALIVEEFPKPEEPRRGERREYAGAPGDKLDIAEFLSASGVVVLGEILDGSAERVFKIVCPWVHEHTGGDRSGTRIGQFPDGALFFHCEHSHCAHRAWPEFRSEVDPRTPAKAKLCKARRVWTKPVRGRSA